MKHVEELDVWLRSVMFAVVVVLEISMNRFGGLASDRELEGDRVKSETTVVADFRESVSLFDKIRNN